MTDPVTVPATEDERRDLKLSIDKLRASNSRMFLAAQQLGVKPDIGPSMISSYFDALVAIGKLTEEEKLAIEFTWETQLNGLMRDNLTKIRAAVEQQKTERAAQAGGIIAPRNKKLIVPGQ